MKINYEPPVMNKELLIRQSSHVSLMLHKDKLQTSCNDQGAAHKAIVACVANVAQGSL